MLNVYLTNFNLSSCFCQCAASKSSSEASQCSTKDFSRSGYDIACGDFKDICDAI